MDAKMSKLYIVLTFFISRCHSKCIGPDLFNAYLF